MDVPRERLQIYYCSSYTGALVENVTPQLMIQPLNVEGTYGFITSSIMHPNLTTLLLGIYGLALGFFFGMLFMGVMPFAWPYDVMIGYLLGGLAGLFVSFALIKRWNLSPAVKIITAMTILAFVAVITVRLQLLSIQAANTAMTLLAQ